jgi:hypothetical protein
MAKSLTKPGGAPCSKGAGNSGLAEFPGAGNFRISGPPKFRLSPLLKAVVHLADKGRKFWKHRISGGRNFRPQAGISAPSDFSLSPLSQVVVRLSGEGRNFWPEIPFWNFRGAGISAPRPEFPPFLDPGISAPGPEFPG